MAWKKLNNLVTRTLLQMAGEKYKEFIRVYQFWHPVVGDLLSEKSHPIKYENHVLYVAVSNNTWMQELILLKKSIIAKYRIEHRIEIQQIVFLIKT